MANSVAPVPRRSKKTCRSPQRQGQPMLLARRRSTGFRGTTNSTAQSATTTTATARCTTRPSFSASSAKRIRFKRSPTQSTKVIFSYDPNQCILCGRCVEACQNLQGNEKLSIRWEDPYPRVLWDDGAPIGESSCVSCGHCVSVCPCNALMEQPFNTDPFTQRSVTANWSSWTSEFESSRINSLQSSSRNLLIASESVGHARPVLSRQNRPQIPKNQVLTAKRRVWRVCGILVSN